MATTADMMKDIQVDAIMKMEQFSEAQKEAMLEQSSSGIVQSIQYVSGVISTIFTAIITALIMMILGNFVGGGQQKYGVLLASALYIQLITIPESIIKIFLILQKESMNVYLGLASFISSPDQTNFFHNLIGQFEFFKIWRIVLWVLAFKILYKFTGKKSGWLVVVIMLIGMLLAAAVATFQGKM
jgi:hypothetical protein